MLMDGSPEEDVVGVARGVRGATAAGAWLTSSYTHDLPILTQSEHSGSSLVQRRFPLRQAPQARGALGVNMRGMDDEAEEAESDAAEKMHDAGADAGGQAGGAANVE